MDKKIHACILQLAIEAITNIRTVAGLGREKMFVKKYIQELDNPHVQVRIAKYAAKGQMYSAYLDIIEYFFTSFF